MDKRSGDTDILNCGECDSTCASLEDAGQSPVQTPDGLMQPQQGPTLRPPSSNMVVGGKPTTSPLPAAKLRETEEDRSHHLANGWTLVFFSYPPGCSQIMRNT